MGDQGSGGLHLSGFLVTLMLLAAWILQEHPLQGSRPAALANPLSLFSSFEDVSARLWEDPFDAVQRHPKDPQDAKQHSMSRFAYYIDTLAQENPDAELSLMPVMVFGGHYAEQREFRLRNRVAVLAGLAVQDLVPIDGEHLGYFSYFSGDGLQINVPFEVLVSRKHIVVLLWLNDGLLSSRFQSTNNQSKTSARPLFRLNDLIDKIKQASSLMNDFSLNIMGPAGSGTLQAMLKELCRCAKPVSEYSALKNAIIYSSQATAPLEQLLPQHCTKENIKDALKDAKLGLIRTIPSDEQLAKLLLKELQLRGIDPSTHSSHTNVLPYLFQYPFKILFPSSRHQSTEDDAYPDVRNHVVLISEWDTTYGRTLPELFIEEVCNSGDKLCGESKKSAWIHRFGYIRGLDGESSSATRKQQHKTNPKDLKVLTEGDQSSFLEPAAGANQFDYLRRLTERIARLDQRLKMNGQGAIKAFGILGSDYYDKLLILQALRERFPNHIFFTTDLDARFLNPKDYPWTRNLLIASAFGLELPPLWQGPIPPFRSTYQTSLFLASQIVFPPKNANNETVFETNSGIKPRIFEVGRGRFFDISEASKSDTAPDYLASVANKGTLQGEPWSFPFYNTALKFVLLIIFLIGLLLMYQTIPIFRTAVAALKQSVLSTSTERYHRRNRNILLAIWAAGFLMLTYLLISIYFSAEPFVLAGGVSIWPSEILRVVAGLLAWLFLLKGWRMIEYNDQQLATEFGLIKEPEKKTAVHDKPNESASNIDAHDLLSWFSQSKNQQSKEPIKEKLLALFPGIDDTKTEASTDCPAQMTDARKLWQEYRQYADFRPRLKRILITFVLFYSFILLTLFGLGDYLTPHRGEATYWFEMINGLIWLGLPFGFLLFAIVDEALLCTSLVRRLCKRSVCWPIFSVTEQAQDTCEALQENEAACKAISDWITIEFIGRRTAPSGNVVYYPFIVILFILASLSSRFDNWDTPGNVMGIIGLSIGIAFSSAYLLRRAANRSRNIILNKLIEQAAGIRHKEASSKAERVQYLIEHIQAIHEGAYRRWYNEPVIRAMIWVLSLATIIITEYISTSGG